MNRSPNDIFWHRSSMHFTSAAYLGVFVLFFSLLKILFVYLFRFFFSNMEPQIRSRAYYCNFRIDFVLYNYDGHRIAVYLQFFVTLRYEFAVKRFYVFDTHHAVFVGQSQGKGVINRSEI